MTLLPRSLMDLIDLFLSSADENRVVRVWPDGRPLLEQPVKLVRAFDVIGAEINWWLSRRSQ